MTHASNPGVSHAQLSDAAANGRATRPFAAQVVCEAIARLADQQGTNVPQAKAPGRWRINSGAQMMTYVWGVNTGRDGWPEPIRLVLDLQAARFESPKIPALYAHSSYSIIGNWTNSGVDDNGWASDLTLYRPADAGEAAAMPDAVKVAAFMRQDHPWQASVGAFPEDGLDGYELVPDGETIELNGQTFEGDGEYPLFVMRKPVCFEASVVLWGADSNTGAIAAALSDPLAHLSTLRKERSMPPAPVAPAAPATVDAGARLKALLAKHGDAHHGLVARLFADGKTDDEIRDEAHKAELAARDAEIARLKQQPMVGVVTAGEPPKPLPAGVVTAAAGQVANPPGFTGQADDGVAPKSLSEAMNRLYAEAPDKWKNRGSELRAAAMKRWPALAR